MTSSPVCMQVWFVAPSDRLDQHAVHMFPDMNHRRIEFRPHPNGPSRPLEGPKGWIEMDGDDVDDMPDFLAIERDSAANFFHRMGTGLRVALGQGAVQGKLANGLRDPQSIARRLQHADQGFAAHLDDIERNLTAWCRWLKPDAHRIPERGADLAVARRLLALLREGRQAGAVSVVFQPGEVDDPDVVSS